MAGLSYACIHLLMHVCLSVCVCYPVHAWGCSILADALRSQIYIYIYVYIINNSNILKSAPKQVLLQKSDLWVLGVVVHLHVFERGRLHIAARERANILGMAGLAAEPVLQPFLAAAHILRRQLRLHRLLFRRVLCRNAFAPAP